MTEQMTASSLATLALLCARGCSDAALPVAYDWLHRQAVPDTTAEVLAQVDEAVRVAEGLTT